MRLSRRTFLAGTAGAAVLTACGGGSDDAEPGSSPTPQAPPGDDPNFSIARFFDASGLAVGIEAQAPLSIADIDGPLPTADLPAEIEVALSVAGEVVETQTVALRAEGVPRGYYRVRFIPEVADIYDVAITADAFGTLGTALQVNAEPFSVIPGPGDPFPSLDTPTADDPRGVTPICTRSQICALHTENLPDLLTDGKPSVVLVSTPEFCQTDACGPVLELVLAEADARPGVSMLHAEVYKDPENDPTILAPLVSELGLPFEPMVAFIDADGLITERLDYLFDASELSEALDRLTA